MLVKRSHQSCFRETAIPTLPVKWRIRYVTFRSSFLIDDLRRLFVFGYQRLRISAQVWCCGQQVSNNEVGLLVSHNGSRSLIGLNDLHCLMAWTRIAYLSIVYSSVIFLHVPSQAGGSYAKVRLWLCVGVWISYRWLQTVRDVTQNGSHLGECCTISPLTTGFLITRDQLFTTFLIAHSCSYQLPVMHFCRIVSLPLSVLIYMCIYSKHIARWTRTFKWGKVLRSSQLQYIMVFCRYFVICRPSLWIPS